MSVRKFWISGLSVVMLASCFADGPTLKATPEGGGSGGMGADVVDGGEPPGVAGMPEPMIPACAAPIDTSEYLPARDSVITAEAAPTERQVLVSELFSRFNAYCGACHAVSDQGGLKVVSPSDFLAKIDEKVLERMRESDPTKQMPPPPDIPWSERSAGDPIVALASDIELWIGKGKPAGGFYVPLDAAEQQQTYSMSRELGEGLTNIGNCLPNRALFASEQPKMLELDELFQGLEAVPFDEEHPALPEELIGLPKTLAETDLFTLDSELLARYGVVAFAPGYPLWSDSAGKLRHVRVPYGETIRFDSERQEFEIPPNTRFYKTFLKEVIDSTGQKRFRKIETRIIVSRPDIVHPDGTHEPTALFGAYKWDDTETRAELVGAGGVGGPFRNGRPFGDLVFPYVTDEVQAQEIRAQFAGDEYYNEELKFDTAGIRRHYGIPSSQRCIECHMGSSSFVLGFTPLQILRRECSKDAPEICAKGGVIEPTGADELTQLQRLIDVGLVSGIESPDEVVLLEDSQGDRKPRNEQELLAQGYMLGNCAHCHNPIGFPSVTAPDIKDLLDFLPRPDGGGIFQFPLDRMSPRVKRDPSGKTPIPYITPSLRDLLPFEWPIKPYSVKFVESQMNIGTEKQPKLVYTYEHQAAPWRSLIFRNTHTPYTYSDDFAIFPHMPLNTPGYDCRASQLLGDWMVSIPAVRKRLELDENYVPIDSSKGTLQPDSSSSPNLNVDREPQPYVEVKPDEKGYADAIKKAASRLEQWRASYVRSKCVDTSDIIAPTVKPGVSDTPFDVDGTGNVDRVSVDWVVTDFHDRDGDGQLSADLYDADGVPDHPHWVATDLTEVRGDWVPRNTKWSAFLIENKTPPPPSNAQALDVGAARAWDAVFLRKELTRLKVTPEIRTFLETPFPLTLWLPKPECTYEGVPKVQDFTEPQRLQWLDALGRRPGYQKLVGDVWLPSAPPSDAPVFAPTPGAIVFDMICRNCHGREADSRGPLAKTIQDMTGGVGRVANFRNGLFGPVDNAGQNRQRVFGSEALLKLFPLDKNPAGTPATWPGDWPGTPDDWGARYMAWMGLGGTEVKLPAAALDLVGRSDVAGIERIISTSKDANMLSAAVTACAMVLGYPYTHPTVAKTEHRFNTSFSDNVKFPVKGSSLLDTIGDAELWLTLCSLDNPPPVRAIANGTGTDTGTFFELYHPLSYPQGADVGNHRHEIVQHEQHPSAIPANLFPFCHVKAGANTPKPVCPDNLVPLVKWSADTMPTDQVKPWLLRGAANAGLAVFVFLDLLSRDPVKHKLIRYDECELIGK
ncbi:MAG TPA: hypothetical protein VJN18_24890 [Polyangiaceae bacterium]|nr:hypothetical protein [Polyangiaceae bacterium]